MAETRKVGVFPVPRRDGTPTKRLMGYVRDYNPEWKGCCEHAVSTALKGRDAVQEAIRQHKNECLPSIICGPCANEVHCTGCGQVVPLPLPMPLSAFKPFADALSKAHAHCPSPKKAREP